MTRFSLTLVASLLALTLQSTVWAQASVGGYTLKVAPGPVLSLFGPIGVTNDLRIEYADSLAGPAPWRLLTNSWVLTQSPHRVADAAPGAATQRFYRLNLATSFAETPQSLTVAAGETALFRAVATSPFSPVTYQWRRNGTNLANGANISGVATTSLTISGAAGGDAGIYSVVATTTNGAITSGPVLLAVTSPDTGVPYGVAEWPVSRGNHRARVAVTHNSEAVWARLPWRRRDPRPEARDIWVIDATTQERMTNVLRVNINREFADLLFQPVTVPGEYHFYYMPFRYEGDTNGPRTIYLAWTNTADSGWTNRCAPLVQSIFSGETAGLPTATILEFQAISDFDRFDPMEVGATAAERLELVAARATAPYLVFPEDRRDPIRMGDNLPLKWIRRGATNAFYGKAARGEFYALQLGVYATRQPLENLTVSVQDLAGDDGTTIPASALRCFNERGTNWLNELIRKTINVATGQVQPLWVGAAIPADATPQAYRGNLTLNAANAPSTTVQLNLEVQNTVLSDAGDSEPWKHSRLRWLDSTLGLDDEVCPPYEPIQETNRTVTVLGRDVHIADGGLLDGIHTRFSRSVDRCDAPPRNILTGPMQFVIQSGGVPVIMTAGAPSFTARAPGMLTWETTNHSPEFEVRCRAKMESDGYINYQLSLKALAAASLDDFRLEIPVSRDVAKYMMGMGHRAGLRQTPWVWRWSANANNALWIGDVDAGLHLKLKSREDRWDLCWIPSTGYIDWANGGLGGCTVADKDSGTALVTAFTGPRSVVPGQELRMNFSLLATPVKTLDTRHWRWRHWQAAFEPDPSVATVTNSGATILNIHSGQGLNPYINYPFLTSSALAAYVREAHQAGLKVKPYYTIRELSNHAAEFWALRSLNFEVLADGGAGPDAAETGTSWLSEHLISGYSPGWQHPLSASHYDAAVLTTGLSRWMNYYIEGLSWLLRNVGIDGLYLDGLGYDREIIKRLRKVLIRGNPGSLMDFHSGNNFDHCGNASSVCMYAEHLPYIDSLWFGEFYDPDESPDFWLLEMSGIPFGLFGEMLQDCGNPWRGMLYGMSARIFTCTLFTCNPRSIWRLWEEAGLAEARMIGYWDDTCPVSTSDPNILATAYVRPGQMLIALASWARSSTSVKLTLDGAATGMDLSKARLRAPAVEGLQPATIFYPTNTITVEPGKGWWLILEPIPGA